MAVHVKVRDCPLSLSGILEGLGGAECGARAVFTGAVRNRNHGRAVRAVTYEAHVPLAERTLEAICREAEDRWGPGLHVAVEHRTGRLEVGEMSVVVAVASVHRDEAFQAARHVIEELKRRVPIWKQEEYEDGSSEWLQGCAL